MRVVYTALRVTIIAAGGFSHTRFYYTNLGRSGFLHYFPKRGIFMTILEFTGLMSLAIQVIGITFKLILFIETHIK